MRMRVIVAAVSVALAGLAIPAHADGDGMRHEQIVDSFSEAGVFSSSRVWAFPDAEIAKIVNNTGQPDYSKEVRCFALQDDACKAKTGLELRIYLPTCTSEKQNFCVEALQVSTGSDSPLVSAVYTGDAGGDTFAADPTRGFPAAGSVGLWQAKGATHSGGGDTYAVKSLMDAYISSDSTEPFVFKISTVVEPYQLSTLASGDSNSACTSWQLGTKCGKRVDLADGQRVALTLHLPNTVTGWLNGRLRNSSIAVTAVDPKINRLRVEADPVTVPELNANFTAEQFNTLQDPGFFSARGVNWDSVDAGNLVALEWIKRLSPLLRDTATGEHSAWGFSTVHDYGNNACLSDRTRLVGLVTTNSLVYDPGAPRFENDTLNYRVGGLHFRSDGKTPVQGTYDLLMRSDVARCLYSFTSAPLSASVSVSYGNGDEAVVATTVLKESEGWLRLAAAGFTFSTPTLRVTLRGTKQSQQSGKTTAAKTAITCVKGKSVKPVTGTNPKCPSGFRKK